MIAGIFRKTSQPVLVLPRFAKRAIALSVDTSLCVLSVWLAFYLRLGEFVSLTGNDIWISGFLSAVGVSVVLALPLAQRLREQFASAEIHFLLRKGNESLLENHPAVDRVWVWNKSGGKTRNLLGLVKELRAFEFDAVYNLHRFGSSGYVTWRMRSTRLRSHLRVRRRAIWWRCRPAAPTG